MKFALAILLVVAVSHGSVLQAVRDNVISQSLLEELRSGKTLDLTIVLKEKTGAVIKAVRAQNFVNSNVKATYLYNQLVKATSESQKQALEILGRQRSAGVKGFYITNKIFLKSATYENVMSILEVQNIEEIRKARFIQLETPIATSAPKALEWGVSNINAPAVWASGFTGKGVVVSTIDTGVRGTHQALASGMRSDYAWLDPATLGSKPTDRQGHGTHTMGSIAGRNGTGVAPGAEWIACAGCDEKGCEEGDLVACGQWTFCPTLSNGSLPNCDKRPNLSSNSWGGGTDDDFYNDIIDSWNEVGIIPIFEIGNYGPTCRSANSPGDQPNLISVGATDVNNKVASFSSHGPSFYKVLIKPEVSAPGVNIRSAGIASDTAYAILSGTSMATPHVAGAVALLLEKNPSLTRVQIASALEESALRPDIGTVVCTGGGVDPDNPWPNNAYGFGKIDISAAIEKVSRK